jgi:SsrA-binding protein
MPTLAINKQARRNFELLGETYEAGIKLKGFEVKAAKQGKVSLRGAYVRIKQQEPWLIGAQISPYQPKNTPSDYDPLRDRKLLLKKSEIARLLGKQQEGGLTLLPLRMYTKKGKVKLELGAGKGLKKTDKREKLKKKEFKRRQQRALKKKV